MCSPSEKEHLIHAAQAERRPLSNFMLVAGLSRASMIPTAPILDAADEIVNKSNDDPRKTIVGLDYDEEL